MSNNGENLHALQKILDFLRMGSILVLLIHFYNVCYPAFQEWKLTIPIMDRIIYNLSSGIPFLSGTNSAKALSLFILIISLLGDKGKKSEKITLQPVLFYILIGLMVFFISSLFLPLPLSETILAELYIVVTSIGYLSIMSGGAKLSRILYLKLGKDTFNDLAETFEQEERYLSNEYSVNLPTLYKLRGKVRKGWINIINPFRALLVAGTPGS
jgi:hypothetical protein